MLTRLYRARWGLLRLIIAGFLLWVLVADHASRLARLQLASLPDMDFASEVATLREEGRFGEAVMIADAGLAITEGPAHDRLAAERARTIDEQSSWLRMLKDIGMGALSGRGDTLEGLAGAVTADLFVVGDVARPAHSGQQARDRWRSRRRPSSPSRAWASPPRWRRKSIGRSRSSRSVARPARWARAWASSSSRRPSAAKRPPWASSLKTLPRSPSAPRPRRRCVRCAPAIRLKTPPRSPRS